MNKPGLIIWGTKRGRDIFFNSENLNIKDQDISQCVQDIRGYLRYNSPKISTYALEFSNKYIVYSLYYSIYDWSNSPGYLAFSLFVPKNIILNTSVHKILEILKENYLVNLDSSSRIKQEKEDFTFYENFPFHFKSNNSNLISDFSISPQNNEFAKIYYKSEDELIKYFSNPQRSEYLKYQEILFIHEDLVMEAKCDTLQTLTLSQEEAKFNIEVKILLPPNMSHTNNYDQIVNKSLHQNFKNLRSEDEIEIKLNEPNYFADYELKGKVLNLVNAQKIIKNHKSEYEWKIILVAKEFPMKVIFRDRITQKALSSPKIDCSWLTQYYIEKDGIISYEKITFVNIIGKTMHLSASGYVDETHKISNSDLKNNIITIEVYLEKENKQIPKKDKTSFVNKAEKDGHKKINHTIEEAILLSKDFLKRAQRIVPSNVKIILAILPIFVFIFFCIFINSNNAKTDIQLRIDGIFQEKPQISYEEFYTKYIETDSFNLDELNSADFKNNATYYEELKNIRFENSVQRKESEEKINREFQLNLNGIQLYANNLIFENSEYTTSKLSNKMEIVEDIYFKNRQLEFSSKLENPNGQGKNALIKRLSSMKSIIEQEYNVRKGKFGSVSDRKKILITTFNSVKAHLSERQKAIVIGKIKNI